MTEEWETRVRTDDPDTSHVAARGAKVLVWRARVYGKIKASGAYGCTKDDLLNEFKPTSHSSVHSRPNELIEMGLVVRLGDKRPGNTGFPQLVNRAVEFVFWNGTGI